MKEITVSSLTSVNIEKLDSDLRVVLNSRLIGVSTRRGDVIVFMTDDTTSGQVQNVVTLVEGHNSSLLTAKQQAEIDRKANLDVSRVDHPNEIDLSRYDSAETIIRQLAKRVQWLEREVRLLRNGT